MNMKPVLRFKLDLNDHFKAEGVTNVIVLKKGNENGEEMFYGIQKPTVLKNNFTYEERAMNEAFKGAEEIKNGEFVVIEQNGIDFIFKTIIKGNFDIPVIFEKRIPLNKK